MAGYHPILDGTTSHSTKLANNASQVAGYPPVGEGEYESLRDFHGNGMRYSHDTACVFFALWPSAAESGQMATWQAPLKHLCGGRAMRAATLHNTLLFLGNIELHRLQALQLAAEEISAGSFELCFDEARYWEHNHIVYASPGLVPGHLMSLVHALEQSLNVHHFKFAQRDYLPHVTLLRNAHRSDEPLPAMPPVCWPIRDFALVQSVHLKELTNYRVLVRFRLT